MTKTPRHLNGFVFAALLACAGTVGATPWEDSYALEAANKYGPAATALDPVLRQWPNHEFALMRRAWLNYQQGRMSDALRDYTQILTANPRSLEARLGMTLPLIAQQRWREAAAEARKVLAMSAWNYTAHVRLMVCEEGERKWDELSRHASELSARFPTDATALVYLARAEAAKGNVKAAVVTYLQVLERIPAHAEALAYLRSKG
jgi:tetratricopeptide (TPR) repeat protein